VLVKGDGGFNEEVGDVGGEDRGGGVATGATESAGVR
jgi:hypothetical protein